MILAIDTATRWLGLALLDETQEAITWSRGQFSSQNQTISAAVLIAEGLATCGITAADLRGIAVAIGPGSYTGLRIGLGVAKGLALANDTPILPVPTFAIWAAALPPADHPLILTAAAGRQRIIAAPHSWSPVEHRWLPSADPDIYRWKELLETIATSWIVAGEISREGRTLLENHPLTRPLSPASCVRQPAVLAQIGADMLARGEGQSAAEVAPHYLRKPQGS